MTTLTPEQIKANFLEQQLQRANTRIEQLLVALGRIQGIAEGNPKIEAVISETLAMPYEFGDDDNATLRGLAIMSAESLRAVWDTSEEDAAWQYLQPVTS